MADTYQTIPGAGYTDGQAVAAVEAENPLDLAGVVNLASAANMNAAATLLTGEYLGADGLSFPAVQVASADPNVLDDSEEGTFTPGLADDDQDGSGEGQTYFTQVGRYVKVGRIVFIHGFLSINSIGTLTGSQTGIMTGLPFTSINSGSAFGGLCGVEGDSMAMTQGTNVTGRIEVNSTIVPLRTWNATTGTVGLTVNEFSGGGGLIFFGHYEAAN